MTQVTPGMIAAARTEIERWEGNILKVYIDVVGVPTGGRGHTAGLTRAMVGQVIPESQSLAWFDQDIRESVEVLEQHVTVPLSDLQGGALLVFIFNLGETNFAHSTLLRELNRGNYAAVPAQLLRFVNGGNPLHYIKGLDNRRHAEVDMWNRGSFAVNPIYPTGSRTMNGGVAAAAGGATVTVGAAAQVLDAVTPAAPAVQPSIVDSVTGAAERATWYFSGMKWIMLAAGLVIVGGALWVIYSRWDDAGRPNPFRRRAPAVLPAPLPVEDSLDATKAP